MVSRDTIAQAGAIAFGFGVFLVLPSLIGVPIDSPPGVVLSVLFNATLFGGAHLYLAVRGDESSVPLQARWRLVALVTAFTTIALLSYLVVFLTALSVRAVATPAVIVIAVVFFSYWYLEARDGYRETSQGTT